ncbi:NUDIX hydrolase [Aquabacter cavernae]|uniref:NUDIX hydrolase n=1 Tax=Aquabacter cavernae TaxID=2496029 RepID=UPI000F8E62ED|nr:NUDIX hydrolase [Aquabacter cavernae]
MARPGCAALAVVARAARVLLVRRANPPDAGLWGFPGGRIEWGEPVAAAAVRELREETGIEALAGEPLRVIDAFDHGPDGGLRHHYVMVAVLCAWVSGEGEAGDDALETGWFSLPQIAARSHLMSACVEEVARAALEFPMAGRLASGGAG